MDNRPRLVPIARVEDIPEAGLLFTFRDGPFEESGILVRAAGVVRAWRNRCRHLSVRLDHGETGRVQAPDGWHLRCTEHGAMYRPDTGECVTGPCRGSHLRPLPIREQAGTVFLEADGLGGLFADTPSALDFSS
ncbi:MAG: Rieske (2Fe-2S) protein [Acidobacteriota bacterium]